MRDTEANSIFRAVLEDPWDDAPRLVLADWMDVNGMPRRAELIRLGCDLANMPCVRRRCRAIFSACDKCRIQKKRQLDLIHHALRDWDYLIDKWNVPGPFSSCSVEKNPDWIRRIHRGFLFRIATTLTEFNSRAKDIFETLPLVDVQIPDLPISPPPP